MSQLHYFHSGDNLEGLRRLVHLGIIVDLVYIDPPFATNNDFLIDKDRANSVSASGKVAYSDKTRGAAYLNELRLRLHAIHDVMSQTGSAYVHIDVKMEHHVRLLMDDVFGAQNFRNSITRIKCNPKNFDRYSYGNIKDTILFYSMSPTRITWHPQREPMSFDDIQRLYPLVDVHGQRYTTTPLHAPGVTLNGPTGQAWRGMLPPSGRHWRYPPERLDELDAAGMIAWSATGNPRKIRYAHDPDSDNEMPSKLPQDVWIYKDPQRAIYPTQKNEEMLERIILTSSDSSDTVLDCYAGSGGTLLQAHKLGRRFIGMDNSEAAQRVIEQRLRESKIDYVPLIEPDTPLQPAFTTMNEVGMSE